MTKLKLDGLDIIQGENIILSLTFLISVDSIDIFIMFNQA